MKKTKENFNKRTWFVMRVPNMSIDEIIVSVKKENLFTSEAAKRIIDLYK